MALLSLIPLCKIINDVTEILSGNTSKNFGILIMTILGNLPDLIIMGPFFSKGHSDIVHGMIIGNLVSTLLLLGASTLIECYKNTTLKFDKIMDIDDETECIKITKYLKVFKIFLCVFIISIVSAVFGFIGGVPEHATSINSFYKDDSNSGLNNAFGSNLIMMGVVLPIFTILG
ncbi:hypothetical protein C2G38_2154790 [Gigaspora rosea]|uniref:Sodium/calcium exchanger membrane region domain-containing protein n=1 Tax=Gigaspora rosea TaxID=44941 RepID=A0A397W6N6_9GLOM|nr:hypothetical protein C2G38_2154790 [Gigaspora rosea]